MIEDGARIAEAAPPQRSARRLLSAWGATLVVEGFLYWVVWRSPAMASLVMPLYVLVALPAAIVTWRWVRPRHDANRREGDRRRLFRRSRKPDRP